MKNFSFMRILLLQFIFLPGIMAQSCHWAEEAGGLFNEYSHDMAIDDNGNIYIIGDIEGVNIDFDPGPGIAYLSSSGGTDIFIAKYDSLGNFAWASSIGGTGDDIGARIVVDGPGNVFITGWFASVNVDFDPGPGSAVLSTAGMTDIYLASYDTDGNYSWAFNTGTSFQEGGHDIALDPSGSLFVTGYFCGTNVDFDPGPGTAYLSSQVNSGDIFIGKYGTDGTYQWAVQASGDHYEVANGITLDMDGNVIITGGFMGTVDFDPGAGSTTLVSEGGYDIFIAKYDGAGSFTWANRIGGTENDIGSDVVAGAGGTIFTTANFNGTGIDFDPGTGTALLNSNGGYDLSVSATDAAGGYLWAFQVGGPVDDFAVKIVLDDQDNVYHTGYFSGNDVDFDPGPGFATISSGGLNDIYFARCDPSGNYSWAAGIGGIYADFGNSLAVDHEGKIMLTGGFAGSDIDFDPGPGTLFLTSGGGEDLFFASYTQELTGMLSEQPPVSPDMKLIPASANPVSDLAVFTYSLPSCENASLKLFGPDGKLIETFLDETITPGEHTIRVHLGDLCPGLYVVSLSNSRETINCRVIKQ